MLKVKIGVSRSRPQWMNSDMTAKIQKKKQAYQKYMQSGDGKDYLLCTSARSQAKSACRSAIKNLKKNIATNAKKSLKAFFCLRQDKK